MGVVVWKVIKVSALSLSLRDKDREKRVERDRACQFIRMTFFKWVKWSILMVVVIIIIIIIVGNSLTSPTSTYEVSLESYTQGLFI